ncbi:ABC transporter permease [Dactylosporangium cerinum]|uniref:ABC transporter permease n=1 Tax=Dactylosporangium cerinum TaxID=1434730 RepID=A0ABV9VL69_9ACTN
MTTTAAPRHRTARYTDVLRSEWTKARTVPSTGWTLLAGVAIGLSLGALISGFAGRQYADGTPAVRAMWDPTSVSGASLVIAQLAIGVLGVLIITSEYATGAIRGALTVVPRRGRFLAAKAVVVAGLAFGAAETTAMVSFFIGQALMSGHAPTAALDQPDVLRAVVGCGLYGMVIGLLGLALGVLLRHAAAAITVLVALLYVLPGLAAALPTSIERPVLKFWPTQAGQQIANVVPGLHALSPWAGFGIMFAFVATLLAAAHFSIQRRDA